VYTSTSGKQFPIQEPKIRGDFCLVECETYGGTGVPEFGTLSVVTRPTGADAEICYMTEGWADWNCGQQMVLPIGKPVDIRVTSKKHKPYTGSTIVRSTHQQLVVELEAKRNTGYKVIGAVAAAVLVGVLLSGSDSGSSDDRYTIILNRPGG